MFYTNRIVKLIGRSKSIITRFLEFELTNYKSILLAGAVLPFSNLSQSYFLGLVMTLEGWVLVLERYSVFT